ncbi:MAG TPA: DHA2 family efflux MFS transporter permease subunit [Candidatus Acidoferrales bacterium]|nr:DHA2 family efflux MFS transporter permease subunit [Candidatus Acidoferrales bacterium]
MSTVVEFGARRFFVVAAVMLAALMQLADTTIVNVALPSIDGTLGASQDEGAWFITAYIIANVIVIPLTPWLQSIFGRRRYFAMSIAGFTLVSILCGLANDTTNEIALRFIQGAFGGGLMVPAQQIIRDTFPPDQLGKSQSLFALAVVIGPTIGPTLGGILTDDLTWRWVFFVNVLPGIAATLLVLLFVRDPQAPKRIPVDAIGIGLLTLGLGTMQYVLDEGESKGWFGDSTILACTAISALALVSFVTWELWGTKRPAVALRVFADRNVWSFSIVFFAIGATMFALIFIQPQYVQNSLDFTTTMAGLLLMVRAGMLVLLYPVTTWVASQYKWDLRLVAGGGILVMGLATWLQTFQMATNATFGTFVLTQALGGVGLAFVFVPLMVVLLAGMEQAIVPSALALTRLMQQIGASVGSAFAATLLDRNFNAALNGIAGSINMGRTAIATAVNEHGAHAIAVLSQLAATQAENLSAVNTTQFFAIATIATTLLPLLMVRRQMVRSHAPVPMTPPPPTVPAIRGEVREAVRS